MENPSHNNKTQAPSSSTKERTRSNYGGNKQVYQDKDKSRPSAKTLADLNLFAAGEYTGLLRTKFTSDTDYYEVANTNLAVSINTLISNSLTAGLVKQAMDSVSASLGYATGIAAADIEGYLEASFKTYVIYLMLQRACNSATLVNEDGNDVFSIFNSLPTAGYEACDVGAPLASLAEPVTSQVPSITNYVWMNTYVKGVSLLRLTPSLKALADYLFSQHFRNPYSQTEGYVTFWTTDVCNQNALTTLPVAFVATLATAQAYLDADGDMVMMLKALGVDKFTFDLDRDQTGQTLKSSFDPLIIEMIINSQLNFSVDITQVDYETEADYSFYSLIPYATFQQKPDTVSVDARRLKLATLMRGGLYLLQTDLLDSDGGIIHYNLFPVHQVALPDITAAGGSVLAEYLYRANAMWEFTMNLPSPYQYSWQIDAAGTAVSATVSTSIFYDGNKGVYLGEAMLAFIAIGRAELIWGAEYLTKLREKLDLMKKSRNPIR